MMNNLNKIYILIATVTLIFIAQAFSAPVPNNDSNERKEKDSVGREWILKQWENGTRPYPLKLGEREDWYQQKWGEKWYGLHNGGRIYSPGKWNWEVVVSVPQDMAAKIKGGDTKKAYTWGTSRRIGAFVWAPGGEQVTDIYVQSRYSYYHYDLSSKRSCFIGNLQKAGNQDGHTESALLRHSETSATLDSVTGRLFFVQDNTLRHIEKLLPYECSQTKRIVYLPAVLDWNELYRKVKSPFDGQLNPVMKEGKRSEPIFVVRSNSAIKTLDLPGARIGKRPLITPDGRGIYFVNKRMGGGNLHDTYTNYEGTSLFDIDTGQMIEKLKLSGDVPRNNWNGTQRWTADGPGSHGGNNVGYDGKIYTAQHGGAGGGPGRMFSIDPRAGDITMLYDSMPDDGTWHKRKSPVIDGPVDAKSLNFTSTLWQVQCPRTGAIINGGWDNSGIRRYHDGFLTTIAGHNYGEFHKPARPDWTTGFNNVHGNNNPSIAPNGDLYIADVNYEEPRILRIYRTDWPKEQPANGYAEKFMPKEKLEALMLEYARNYIEHFSDNNRILESK